MDTANLSLEEKLQILERDLPVPIRAFLHSPERDATSLRLSQKYGLHADQAGAFEQAYIYMLLGINTPEDFVQDLRRAGIPQETVRGLTNDINEQVFKRLQQQELAIADAPKPAYRTTPDRPAVPVPQVTPTAQPTLAQNPAPEVPPYNLVRPDVLVPASVQHSAVPLPPAVQMRTMQHDIQVLQDPNTPPLTVPNMPHPSQVTPARSFQTASVPFTSIPSAPQPTPVPHQVINPPKPAPAALPPQSAPQAPVMKEHGGDPYREPI